MGVRAFLAFQYCERDKDGEPSDDAELGALMHYERWTWDIALARGFYEVFAKK